MGVDLTLVPDRFETGSRPILGYTRLPLMCRWYRLHEVLRGIANPLPEGLMWYADEGVETVKVDAYGDDLRWVLPSQFLKAVSETTENLEPWDKAVVAFIRELSPMTRIVLWFH